MSQGLKLTIRNLLEKLKLLQKDELLRQSGQNWQICKAFVCNFVHTLHKEKIFLLFGGFFTLIFLEGLVVSPYMNQATRSLNQATRPFRPGWAPGLWRAIVTITTVGYGYVVPHSLAGRLVGACLMISGLLVITLLTATVASIFVQRKIRRERGLEAINDHDHVIILGWNKGG